MTLPRGWELILIVVVIVLLFGAKRMPDAARSVGRSLRIFKAETKGLMDDDDDEMKSPEQLEVDQRRAADQRAAELEAEAERLRRGETA